MGDVILGQFDTFRPRRPAKDKDTEIAVAAAIDTFGQIEAWARARRQVVEAKIEPPARETIKKALEIIAVMKDQPR